MTVSVMDVSVSTHNSLAGSSAVTQEAMPSISRGMIGVDVSKGTLDAALALQDTKSPVWERQTANSSTGIQLLLQNTDPSYPWVVEPTGRYSSLIVDLATRAGRTVLLAPNRAAKLYLKSENTRVKSDRIDSFGLARFGLSRPLSPFRLKSEPVEQLDQLLSARKGLAGALSRLKLQRSELTYAQELLTPAIEALEIQIKVIEKSIQKTTHSHVEFALAQALETIPGVGVITAAALASRLVSKEFATKDAFVAYIGLDVAVRESGQSKGRVKLTKQGDAELRRLLYLAAMSNLRRKESVFKDQYERLKGQGRSSTAALNIVARKIAHVCWAMREHGGTFDPTKVCRKPEPKEKPEPTETE